MDRRVMEKLEEGVCRALNEVAEKGMNSAQDVETAKAALSGMVKMKMLEEMDNFKDNGYSGRMYRDDGGSYRSYGMYRDDGSSYRGYHDGYSGHGVADKILSKMKEMYDNADGRDKQEIEMWINRLESQRRN